MVRVAAIVAVALCGLTFVGAADKDYGIQLPDRLELTPAGKQTFSLTMVAAAGHRVSQDGPLIVTLTAEPKGALVLPKRTYRRRDAADARAASPRFDIAVQAKAAGAFTLSIDARFWLCAKKTCRPVQTRRKLPVSVGTPVAPAEHI